MNKALNLGSCKVSFSHEFIPEHVYNKKKDTTEVVRKPVATKVTIEHGDKEVQFARVSCSKKDVFTFEQGRKEALKKVFTKTTTVTKEERRRVWEEYNKLKPGGRW